MGRRLQLFSPSPEKNGSPSSTPRAISRPDQQHGSFHRGRKQREHRVEPQEKEIRPGRGLNDGRVRLPARTERAE